MVKIEKWTLPDDLYYRKEDHIWALVKGNIVLLGLDDFGQTAAGNIMKMKTFPEGKVIKKDQTFGTIESGKYVGPMKSPLSGKIVKVNHDVVSNPKVINFDPYGSWILEVEPTDFSSETHDLEHGEDSIREWMTVEIEDYRAKGLLPDE